MTLRRDIRESLLKSVRDLDVVKYGDFILRSGDKSNVYVDAKALLGSPKSRDLIASYFLDDLHEGANYVAGSGVGGTVLATELSTKYNLGLTVMRREQKGYGTKRTVEMDQVEPGSKYIVVDELATTGGTIMNVAEKIKQEGGDVLGFYVVVDRSEEKPEWQRIIRNLNAPLYSIFTSRDLGILK